MKVETSASKFRALVQELTGINSDAERFMEINSVGDKSNYHGPHDEQQDQRLMMKREQVEDFKYNESCDDHVSYFPMINTTGFCDFPTNSTSEYYWNDQSIFS